MSRRLTGLENFPARYFKLVIGLQGFSKTNELKYRFFSYNIWFRNTRMAVFWDGVNEKGPVPNHISTGPEVIQTNRPLLRELF